MRVLIVEDYGPLRKALGQGLEEAGFAVDISADGEEGLWYARSNEYDVIVLDLMLPRVDGLTILNRLRAEGSAVPILILTAKDTVDDRVRGLNLGADDYLVKPFALIQVGDLQIDTAARVVNRAKRRIDLSAREYALLEYLALHAGKVVSRTGIWEHIYDFHSDPESNVVDVYFVYLRKKIARPGLPKLIHTRRGQGYLLGPSS